MNLYDCTCQCGCNDSADVQCSKNHTLVMKSSNGAGACVNSHSVEKLIQRGWAIQF